MIKLAALTILAVMFVAAAPHHGFAQEELPELRVAYSVKFLCSRKVAASQPFQLDVQGGDYATDVNLHNFTRANVPIFVKATEARGMLSTTPGIIGAFRSLSLGSNEAMYIGCNEIRSLLGISDTFPAFKSGFVEILSPIELSVVGVYTVKKCLRAERGPVFGGFACDGEPSISVVPQRPFAFTLPPMDTR